MTFGSVEPPRKQKISALRPKIFIAADMAKYLMKQTRVKSDAKWSLNWGKEQHQKHPLFLSLFLSEGFSFSAQFSDIIFFYHTKQTRQRRKKEIKKERKSFCSSLLDIWNLGERREESSQRIFRCRRQWISPPSRRAVPDAS